MTDLPVHRNNQQSPNQHLWLFPFPPKQMFLFCVFFSLAGIIGAALTLSSQPSLGGEWEAVPDSHDGLVLKNSSHFQAFAHQSPVRVQALADQQGTVVSLHRETLLADPDQYDNFAAFNRFMAEQEQLAKILHNKDVNLILDNGHSVSLPVKSSRSPFSLPFPFWIYAVVGMLCFLISAGVWCYRRGDVSSRLLALTGFGFFASLLCLAIYANRELALDASLFHLLSAANHFFIILFCYALLLLFCYYPCPLGNSPLVIVICAGAALIWLNETFQWYEPPIHAYFLLNHIIPYCAAIVLGIVQWHLTKRQPVNRAALRWFLLSIWISIGGAGAMFIVPSISGQFEIIPLWITAFGVLAMFVFFALGTLRCGLFGLEKWWFSGWAWMITGAIVILVDLLVVTLLQVNMSHLLPVSILLLGWLYFPARYWLLDILERKGRNRIEDTLPQLLQTLFSSGDRQDIIGKWPGMLKQIFQPLELTALPSPASGIVVRENGLILEVPGVEHENGWRLTANRSGTKLFGPEEQKLAAMVHDLARTILDITARILSAHVRGAEKERERIMRDLHDDVLPKLITLKHRSSPPLTETADAAFQSLRDCIYLLRAKNSQPVADGLADWRVEVAGRLEPLAIKLNWTQPEIVDCHVMTSLQQINGNRIVQEAISNIIKHAEADTIDITVSLNSALTLTLIIADNGKGIPEPGQQSWHKIGAGNMLARASELDGTVQWRNRTSCNPADRTGFEVLFSFPLLISPDQLSRPQGENNA
jgi:signal transduction histidine kinase